MCFEFYYLLKQIDWPSHQKEKHGHMSIFNDIEKLVKTGFCKNHYQNSKTASEGIDVTGKRSLI